MRALFCLCILAAVYLLGLGNVLRALDKADAALKQAYADYAAGPAHEAAKAQKARPHVAR